MINQDLQREAERYAEYQREQEAYEQAQYDDELSKAHEHIRTLEAQLARVRELPRYGTQEIKDEYGDDPSVMWIAEYELESALDNPKSAG